MINYVNNAYDKVLKPCDAQRFSIITNSQETERLILAHRGGDEKAKAKLPALTYMGVFDKEKWANGPSLTLPREGTRDPRKQGTRKAEFMRPTGLLMMDFDHRPNPRTIYDALLSCLSSDEIAPASVLALAHITPSGDGLRLVLKREKGKSIEQEQYEWFKRIEKHHEGKLSFDDVCKDISRLSFAPMQKEILYFNPSLLFGELPNAEDYPNDKAPLFSPPKGDDLRPSVSESPLLGRGTGEAEYKGIPYAEIVQRLEEQLGGRPERGARNSFIFTMACNLRYICDDNAEWVASILPTYGEDEQKHRMTIQSAINRPMSREMPETLKRALNVAKLCTDADSKPSPFAGSGEAAPPAMPAVLPEPIALLTSRTPEKMKPAVAMSVFPALGAHLHEAKFRYIDNRDYEATFMHVLVAELSSGKSAVNIPIDYILADIEARDDVARERERKWKEQCATISNTKDRPERPKGLAMQVLSADMTNAAFVQRLADAEGRFLYTQMDEIELLDSLKTNTRGGSVSAVLRLAFDCGKYGQERIASNAVNAKVRVRWNWNASTTVQRVRKYFAGSIADGTLSRMSFSTIVSDADDWGEHRPRFGDYGNHFADELRPYIDALCACKGTICSPEAEAWAEALCDELIAYARQIDDRSYAKMSFRAVLMGFFRAMLLYVMNGMRWTEEIAQFATWTVKYDLWCKLHFFGDKLRQDLEGETAALQANPRNLLDLLPREFTRQMAQEMRIAQGRKPNPTNMLSQWVFRGFITLDKKREVYVKVS